MAGTNALGSGVFAGASGVGSRRLIGRDAADSAQPAMAAAARHLQAALDALDASRGNKGGHREKARSLIADALAEVLAGIAFGQQTSGAGEENG